MLGGKWSKDESKDGRGELSKWGKDIGRDADTQRAGMQAGLVTRVCTDNIASLSAATVNPLPFVLFLLSRLPLIVGVCGGGEDAVRNGFTRFFGRVGYV